MEKLQNTEDKILDAAKQVFHKKGFNGARMQEIADYAGINKALLHYYFRNKETLFERVFKDAFAEIAFRLINIFNSEIPLNAKIENFIDFYLSFIAKHSYIIYFIINALHEKPEKLREIIINQGLSPEKFLLKIQCQLKDELDIDIDPLHIYVNMLALVIFPVVARPLIQNIFGYSDDKMMEFFEQRKKIVPTFILNALKGYENHKDPVKD